MSAAAVSRRLSGFGDEIAAAPQVQTAVLQAVGARQVEVRRAWGVNVIDLDEQRSMLDRAAMGVSAIASPVGEVDVGVEIEAETARRTSSGPASGRSTRGTDRCGRIWSACRSRTPTRGSKACPPEMEMTKACRPGRRWPAPDTTDPRPSNHIWRCRAASSDPRRSVSRRGLLLR